MILIPWDNKNKTAGYHRHILRPPNFVKKDFKKMKTFFLEKTLSFHHSFQFFQRSIFSNFCQKNLIITAEKTFLNNTNWYAFYSKFTTCSDFQKTPFFSKKNIYFFSNKTQILNVFRNLTISVALYDKFPTSWL